MIKDFFEIETKQKNTFLIFLGLTLISFLQIFIFKKDVLKDNFFIVFGLSLAIALCWTILNMLPIMFIVIAWTDNHNVIYEKFIFGSGILIIAGQILLTYLAYKEHLTFEEFIDYAWIRTLSTYAFVFIILFINQALGKKKT